MLFVSDQPFARVEDDPTVSQVLDRLVSSTHKFPLRRDDAADLLMSALLGIAGAALALGEVRRKGRTMRKVGALREGKELLEGTAVATLRLLRALPDIPNTKKRDGSCP